MRLFISLVLSPLCVIMTATAQLGSGNACVYQSIVWQVDGDRHRTEISSRATDSCKEISYTLNDRAYEGVDCNCDLIVDGYEDLHGAPPERLSQALFDVCHGPIADPLIYDKPTSIVFAD